MKNLSFNFLLYSNRGIIYRHFNVIFQESRDTQFFIYYVTLLIISSMDILKREDSDTY